MRTVKWRLARAAIAIATLMAMSARIMAAEGFEFNLMQYELSFGQGRAQHAFHLSNFVAGERFGDLALGENGRVRIPLFSTDPSRVTLLRNSDTGGAGASASDFVAGALGLATVALMIAYLASAASEAADSVDNEPIVDLSGLDPRTLVPSTTSTSPAKR